MEPSIPITATLAVVDRTFDRIRDRFRLLFVPVQRSYVEARTRHACLGEPPPHPRGNALGELSRIGAGDVLGGLLCGWLRGGLRASEPLARLEELLAGTGEAPVIDDDAPPLEWNDRLLDAVDAAQAELHAIVAAARPPVQRVVLERVHRFCADAQRSLARFDRAPLDAWCSGVTSPSRSA